MSANSPHPVARIGMINFINTAPLYEVWKRTVHRADWQVAEAVPLTINRLLSIGELDLGFISSYEYAVHPDRYLILPDLSISASGSVGSVFLFARQGMAEMGRQKLLLTSQSQTSVSLLKIILEEFVGVQPHYHSGSIRDNLAALHQYSGILAIGDEALHLKHHGDFPVVIDLSRVWWEHTGLPFVFALWAARREFCDREPEEIVAIHTELVRCLAEGLADLANISRTVAARVPLDPEECYRYLQGIEYDLSPRKQQGLALFYQYLIKRGEGLPSALPLQFWASSRKVE
ncbi:MAG: menaquinone biosynthesis protein [Desulfobulbaceae bacterium]|nr:menaquinone biosynthesis protein [Desulfobulbaceae bacterium]